MYLIDYKEKDEVSLKFEIQNDQHQVSEYSVTYGGLFIMGIKII